MAYWCKQNNKSARGARVFTLFTVIAWLRRDSFPGGRKHKRQFPLSFSQLGHGRQEFNSRKIRQHFETARSHISGGVFAGVFVVVA